jgi:hypothetical protein
VYSANSIPIIDTTAAVSAAVFFFNVETSLQTFKLPRPGNTDRVTSLAAQRLVYRQNRLSAYAGFITGKLLRCNPPCTFGLYAVVNSPLLF